MEVERSGKGSAEPFQCTECGVVEWRSIIPGIEANEWPEHCKEVMRLLPSDEADKLTKPVTAAIVDVDEEAA